MKDKIFAIIFIAYLLVVLILNITIKDSSISLTERRKLVQLPKLSADNILDKSFMEEFDLYVTDQFVFRDEFRKIKAKVNYDILRKIDNNKIYLYKEHILKSEYPTNKKSIKNFVNKINSIKKNLSPNNKIYYSIIPDKNYYVHDKKYLNIDYDFLYNETKKINYTNIELRDVLTLNDYYKTDTHWKQENLCKVVNRIGNYLDFSTTCSYDEKKYDKFYGVYYGQSALNLESETLTYLTNETILKSNVYYLENSKTNKVYIENNLNNLDSYDIFLDGATAYIEITNELSKTKNELIIFRDSFASSLAPLLIENYAKITLIDLRYINSDNYLKKVDFNNQDILFLYSTLLVNNSYTLKN